MARREERAYREYVSDEQRSQPGCPARELCDESLLRDTRAALDLRWTGLPVCESIFGTLVCLRADLKPLKRSHTNLTLTGCCFTRTLTPTVFFSTPAMTRHVRS